MYMPGDIESYIAEGDGKRDVKHEKLVRIELHAPGTWDQINFLLKRSNTGKVPEI